MKDVLRFKSDHSWG